MPLRDSDLTVPSTELEAFLIMDSNLDFALPPKIVLILKAMASANISRMKPPGSYFEPDLKTVQG
jgi:hypothetical protein